MVSNTSTVNPFETAKQQVDIVADLLGLDGGMREVLKHPKRELTVNFPVRMDDGIPTGSTPGTACSTTWRAAPARAASATTRR